MKHSGKWARIVIDVALAALLVAVMATALVQEVPHELLGIAVFACVVAHVVLNRRRFKALFRGRYNAVRMLQLVAVVGLVACIVGQMASSLVLSKFVFGFLPALPGASLARRVHMLCSYWGFAFAFAHAGLQFKGFERLVRPTGGTGPGAAVWLARIAFVAIACYGVYSFMQLNMGDYLFGQVQFALADYATPIVLACARYAAIAMLVTGLFHYLRRVLERRRADKAPGREGRGE